MQSSDSMVSNKEIQDLRRALAASLDFAQSNEPQLQLQDPIALHRLESEPVAKNSDDNFAGIERLPPYQRQSIRNEEYVERRNIELFKMHTTELELNEGDTLVFVDFPAVRNGKIAYDCSGLAYRSQKFRVHSSKLIATGSSKFIDMLKPSHQFRAQRRRNLVNKLPDGIRFVLDLTPPGEGDEMVFQMTELSLTPGIIKWWSSYARLNVPFFLVKGHDDSCSCKELALQPLAPPVSETILDEFKPVPTGATMPNIVTLPLTVAELVSFRNNGKLLQIEKVPDHFNIPDYCPIRHRAGIIRLLMLIEGKEVFLDSAPRVWTLVALAKIWDCVSVVQDKVIQWLLHGKNSQFIEILPEEALRIGGAIESAQVTQTAFKILVNELALEEASSCAMKEAIDFSHVTVFGRRKGDAGDEFSNLIQHAARALVERVTAELAQLRSDQILDAWELPEWQKLQRIEDVLKLEDSDRFSIHLNLITELKNRFRAVMTQVIETLSQPMSGSQHYATFSANYRQIDADRARYVEPQDFKELDDIDPLLTPIQKLLLRYPYTQLAESWTDSKYLNHMEASTQFSAGDFEELLRLKLATLHKEYVPLNQATWKHVFDASDQHWLGLEPDSPLPFQLNQLEDEVESKLRAMGGRDSEGGQDLHTFITWHMTMPLTNNEKKYLPLWAGGCNDGTGGVFEDHLPPAHMGPNGPGPAYHTGITIPSDASSMSGSFVDDMSATNMAGSNTAASVDVHDSVSTVFRSDHVITDDKSIMSESFHSDFSDYDGAKMVVRPPEQLDAREQTLDEFLLSIDSDDNSTSTICNDDDFELLEDSFDMDGPFQTDSPADGSAGTDTKMVTA
ncbi:hypothetical protein NQ176_g6289 [Zarea fungicola]|uniref:Uncharacterized protein n=1 Tax=Zarea fungicola TaxID=93591 RepID=A0ACC1N5C4_9HYPO|nr:hypothetical protein NQ176_g6289 [Lecanicillium fungicola]